MLFDVGDDCKHQCIIENEQTLSTFAIFDQDFASFRSEMSIFIGFQSMHDDVFSRFRRLHRGLSDAWCRLWASEHAFEPIIDETPSIMHVWCRICRMLVDVHQNSTSNWSFETISDSNDVLKRVCNALLTTTHECRCWSRHFSLQHAVDVEVSDLSAQDVVDDDEIRPFSLDSSCASRFLLTFQFDTRKVWETQEFCRFTLSISSIASIRACIWVNRRRNNLDQAWAMSHLPNASHTLHETLQQLAVFSPFRNLNAFLNVEDSRCWLDLC